MSNLIPERRVNKNGVAVTKHVRGQAKSSSNKTPPPAPALQGETAAAKSKLRPNQLQQRERSFSPLENDADRLLIQGRTGMFTFTASDKEIYDVMSVTRAGDAMALLEIGVRTSDEALDILARNGLEHRQQDRSAIMQELLKRNIAPEKTTKAFSMLDIDREYWANEHERDTDHYPDVIEYLSLESYKSMHGSDVIKNLILSGGISFSDIKDIGTGRLRKQDRLYHLRATLTRHNSGKTTFTNNDLKRFLDKCDADGVVGVHFHSALVLFELLGADSVDRLEDTKSFSSRFRQGAKVFFEDIEGLREETEVEFYAALLMEGMERYEASAQKSGRYWAQEFPQEVQILRGAGVKVDDAIPLLGSGMSAQQAAGVMNGTETVISEGWL